MAQEYVLIWGNSGRTFRQVTDDEKVRYPVVAEHLKVDFYVDDMLSGIKTTKAGKILIEQMTELIY